MANRSPEIRVPREAGLVCTITWSAYMWNARCIGCGWEMDRPQLYDIHDHILDPGFSRVRVEGDFFAFVDEQDRYHRENGPALVHKLPSRKGTGEWYRHGKLHREDGPAVVSVPDLPDFNEWWFDGEQIAPVHADGYHDILQALEGHEDSHYLLPLFDTLLHRNVLEGLVRGAQTQRVD